MSVRGRDNVGSLAQRGGREGREDWGDKSPERERERNGSEPSASPARDPEGPSPSPKGRARARGNIREETGKELEVDVGNDGRKSTSLHLPFLRKDEVL